MIAQTIQRVLCWSICCIALSVIADNSEAQVVDVKNTVHAFLQAEFDEGAATVRKTLITFSSNRYAELDQKTEPGVEVFDLDIYDQAFIVKNFKILGCKVDGKKATATVMYQRLARVENFNTSDRRVLPDRIDRDLVTLNLIFDKNQWWVLDPPPPRVSKEVLLEYYEYRVNSNLSRWDQELIDPQYDEEQKANIRASRDQAVGALRILKSLP